MNTYIFTSEKLGFRNWKADDVDLLFKLNSNQEVMRYFPSAQTKEQCADFIGRMQNQFEKNKFCYFAVDLLETEEFIGFIGISEQTYEIDFNPSVDIGWRVLPEYWGKGYATEGARACLRYGFETIQLEKIVSVAPSINIPSITVMKKIGMEKVKTFNHPLLTDYPKIEECVLFEITKN